MIHLALAVIGLTASAAATGYTDGKEYVYRYTGTISTGYPRIKPQESGYIFNALLRVQPEEDHAIFKMDHVTRAAFNDEFEDVTRAHHEFKDLPPFADFPSRPFRVHRKNGIVTHFEVTRDEPVFSVNLKKGLVALFNLNFDQIQSPGTSVEDNEILRSDPDEHYFTVFEETTLGECETAYVIEHHPFDHIHNIVLNVTKVRNFHNCITRPNQVYSVFLGHECVEVDHEKSHTLHGDAQYRYSIRGDRHHYVIEKITSESDVGYTPYPMDGQTVSTTIKRSLELIEVKPVSETIGMSNDLVDVTSLVYEFEFQKDFREPVDLKKPHYLYHLTGRKVPVSDVRSQMEELVKVYQDDTYSEKFRDKEFPAKFVELLRSAATLGYDEIEDLYKFYADIPKTTATEEQRRYRSLFMDTLVNLGTNPAFAFGKYLIETNKVNSREALDIVQQLQFHLKEVSETLLDELQQICFHSQQVRKKSALHLACVATLSNIVFERCVARYHPEGIHEGKNVCPRDVALKYFNYIINLYKQTSNVELKCNYIKAAGSIGIKEIIPYVKPYIEGRGSYTDFEREISIWALHDVGHTYPRQVRSLVLPLFFNQTENYRMRLSAFILLLQIGPKLYEMEGLARALKYEKDDQVRSYVYSTLKSFANSTHICDRRLAKEARYALRILEDVRDEFEKYDYSFSKFHYFGGYDPHYDFGGSTTFAYFASDTGYLPSATYLKFEDYIGGKSMHTFGGGFKQFGLEKFLDRILGPEGSLGRRSLFDLFKKRDKRDVSGTQKELNEIKEKINLPVKDYDKIHFELFFHHMGRHMSSYQFHEKDFEQFFKEGRFVIPNIPAAFQKVPAYTFQRFELTVDKFYVLPTESGVPLLFDYKQPVYYYNRNKESSFRVEPGFFAEDRGGQYPEHVRAETDGHLAIDKNLIAYMGVVIPFDQTIFGGGINRRATLSLPLKVKVDLEVREKKIKFNWTPVAPHEIYHFKYEPFTFLDSYGNSVPQTLEKGYKPVKRVHGHEVQKHFFHDYLGVGFDVRADYENEFNDFGSYVDFFLQKDFREKFYYLYANPHFEPYHFDVLFTQAQKDATKEVEVDFSYHYFEDSWINPHFPEENFDDFDRQKEGKSHFSTCAIKANVVAKGDRERKIHMVTSWTRDLLGTFHKLNFFYERNPFSSLETEDFKICGSSYLKYPSYDLRKLIMLDSVGMDHTVHSEMKVHFGKSCTADQKLKAQLLITPSEEQRELESRREEPDTPEHYNPYSHLYHECMKWQAKGINNGDECVQYFDLATNLHKYALHIKHENLSPGFLNKTYLVDRVLKFMFYTHSDHNEIGVQNPVDEVHLEANFSLNLPVADIRVRKPTSNSNYYNVYLPMYDGFTSFPYFEECYTKKTISDVYCKIENDNVFTFDRYEYPLPPTDCYRVVSKDCSPNEYFTVLSSKINHPLYQQALKVFLGAHKVEILPVSDESDIVVRVDGKRVEVSKDEPYLHKEEGELVFYVTSREPYYALHSQKYGLIVFYEGKDVSVQTSIFYRGKLCGLCGNYNGQKYDGSTTSEGCYYPDEEAYAYFYTIPSDSCTVTKAELVCPVEGGFGCTRLRTKVLQLSEGTVPQTCFSNDPVSECAEHCQSAGMIPRKVSFHCLPAKDDSTKSLLKEQEERILSELARKSKDHVTVVEIPDRCYKK